ncbi:Cation/H+ exchanger [Phascolomyces articulosus]|uniref:Cation/H+ exchanger n=1 Tax=Phascolomyces articulosus TaxID=60185 RepID=A0AAD5JXY5_9FUNG|nr:Cation/H+ exchanger [Phascolomyces articulosus]
MITSLDLGYLLVGAFSIVLIATSNIIRDKLYLNEALLAVVFGIIIGPYCLNLVNVDMWDIQKVSITTQVTRIVIAIQVMITGAVTLPRKFVYNNYKSMLIMLIPVMLGMWFISGSLVYFMIPYLDFIQSLLIASCFTPTDPVLSSSIVQGYFAEKNVRREIRDLIAAESAANDGLGYPFLFIAIYWMQMSVGDAFRSWVVHIMLQQIALSIILGIIIGCGARISIKWCFARSMVELEALHLYPLMISFVLMGLLTWIKSDDLLACFMAGCALSWDEWFQDETASMGSFLHVLDSLLNIGVFIYIGVTMPFSLFVDLSIWRLIVLAMLVLFFRRIPVVLGLYKTVPLINGWREALFTGWFGPIGVGAIFYYTVADANVSSSNMTEDGKPITSTLAAVVYFVVLSSVIVHGLSIPIITTSQYIYRRILLDMPLSPDVEKSTSSKTAFSFTRTTTGTSEATTAVDN